MSTLTQAEIDGFAGDAAAAVRAHWPSATAAGWTADATDTAVRDAVWKSGQSQGWFDLVAAGEFRAVLAIGYQLGKLACPVPVVDGAVVSWLLPDADPVRVVVVAGTSGRYVDAFGADHALVLGTDTVVLHPVAGRRERPGMARPSWEELELGQAVLARAVEPARLELARWLIRLGLAARACGAAARTHELAVEHARQRVQFGKIIGSFGAVQQRVAAAQIDVTGAELLLQHAAAAIENDGDDRLACAIAVEHAVATASRVQLAAHHTLAAIGYFDEHEGPWLFRRVHADISRVELFAEPGETVADQLAEGSGGLPDLRGTGRSGQSQADRLRVELRELFAAHAHLPLDERKARLRAEMVQRGLFGMGWPPEHGGRSASVEEQVALNDEIQYWRAPVRDEMTTVMLLGEAIVRHGSAQQQAEFLPRIRRGEIRFCLGYSEPEVGSDLASVRTKAVRHGDEWVINGQKTWTTNAHVASHIWLAVRTDPEASPRHAGISVFLLPMSTPGITVQQHTALSGEVSCSVFFDDVRVPDAMRVGPIDGGWAVVVDALAGERIVMGSVAAILRRLLDDVLAVVRRDPVAALGTRGSAARARFGEVAVGLQATRALVAAAIGNDESPNRFAPMAAVQGGELAEQFGEAMLATLGPQAALAGGSEWPAELEYYLRLSIMYVVGGGTNDIQRAMIARGLGLPR